MCAILVFICSAVSGGEPQRVTMAPGLIELRLPSIPDGADVSWEAKQPLTLDFRQYESGAVFVSYATGGELVIVSDVIDWESKKRDKTTWIVKIEGTKPPEPTPDPTVPPPTGLAGEIYALAKPINQPAKCLKYADNYEVISTEIAAGALTSLAQVRQRVQQLNEPLLSNPRDARWEAVGTFLQSKIAATASVATVRDVFDAAVIGLRAAGGVR